MKRLNGVCKRFIVQGLAVFMSPSEVAEAVQAEFGVSLTRQQVQSYDPTKHGGGARLSQSLRDLFTVTRQHFVSSADHIGLAHLTYRLECLEGVLRRAIKAGNEYLVLQVLEQAAKEVGGWYVRRRDAKQPQNEATARLLARSPADSPVDLSEWRRVRQDRAA